MSEQVNQPAAWAALRENGSVYACHESREMVKAVSRDGMRIVPLYTGPTITEKERDAMEFFADLPWAKESGNAVEAAAIRGFLDRHTRGGTA
jgi:hypothetical protein